MLRTRERSNGARGCGCQKCGKERGLRRLLKVENSRGCEDVDIIALDLYKSVDADYCKGQTELEDYVIPNL